jgi:hypothetical protein
MIMETQTTPVVTAAVSKIEPMPPEIAGAIIQVMAEIGVLAHNAQNTHNQYAYASVDAFLAATNPLCAKHGLIVMPVQIGVQKEQVQSGDKILNVMDFSFQFLLAHKSGKTWMNPVDVRNVRLLWSGAQTSGMAQSYVQKQYMRGLFQIATGDKDADADEKLIDEAPKRIAEAQTKRRDTGKKPTSKLVELDFGHIEGPEPLGVDEVVARVSEYLTGADKDVRARWRAKNSAALEALHKLDKPKWLAVGQLIENGVTTGF